MRLGYIGLEAVLLEGVLCLQGSLICVTTGSLIVLQGLAHSAGGHTSRHYSGSRKADKVVLALLPLLTWIDIGLESTCVV